MTDFKRASAEVDDLLVQLQRLQEDSEPALARAELFDAVNTKCTALQQRMLVFDKRLTETDPISGELRYGAGMRAKVSELRSKYDGLLAALPAAEALVQQAMLEHTQQSAKLDEAARRQQREELLAQQQQQIEQAQRQAAEAAAAQEQASIIDQERRRIAAEALRTREQRAAAEAAAVAQAAAEKAAAEERAAQLMASVPVGAAGVDDGMRRIEEALAGDARQKRATYSALLQVSFCLCYCY
jgi:myosin heavy subunit